MKRMKRLIAILLAGAMLFSFLGCICSPKQPSVPVSEATEQPMPQVTDRPTESPTDEPTAPATEVPIELTEEQKAAEAAFWALDDELFRNQATSDITALDQYCVDPASFGIDESTVPVTLGEFTEEANNEWVAKCRVWREKLNEIDRNLLNPQLQFAYDTYCRYFDMEIESADWFYCYEPLDEYVGLHLNMPLFFGLYSFKDEKDIENYLTLMADMPRYYGQVLAFEQKRADLGLFMTEEALDVILSDLQTVAESGETSYLHATFRDAMEKQEYLAAAQREAYIAKNDELVKTSWVEAYRLLHDGLETLRPKCRARVGAYEQGGMAYDYYCWKIRSESSNNRSVEDAIKFLEDCNLQVYKLFYLSAMNCYDDLVAEKKITEGSLESDEAYLKTLMPKIVPPMPDVRVTYTEVPKELQDGFSPAAYLTPALDGYMDNIILTNPKDDEHYSMSTLAHEGFPGHMFQFTYQYNLGTIPKFQLMIETNGYAESWSTNAEWNVAQLNEKYGKDLCVATFLNEYFGNILVTIVSLKVNGQGASIDEIKKYLGNWGLGDYAQGFYDYAIDMPIYYFKYTGGFCELFDLTNRCNKGDLVEFFTEYLHWGPSYFDLLDERMEAWKNAK